MQTVELGSLQTGLEQWYLFSFLRYQAAFVPLWRKRPFCNCTNLIIMSKICFLQSFELVLKTNQGCKISTTETKPKQKRKLLSPDVKPNSGSDWLNQQTDVAVLDTANE